MTPGIQKKRDDDSQGNRSNQNDAGRQGRVAGDSSESVHRCRSCTSYLALRLDAEKKGAALSKGFMCPVRSDSCPVFTKNSTVLSQRSIHTPKNKKPIIQDITSGSLLQTFSHSVLTSTISSLLPLQRAQLVKVGSSLCAKHSPMFFQSKRVSGNPEKAFGWQPNSVLPL